MKFNNKFSVIFIALLIGLLLLTGCSDDEVTKKDEDSLITFSDNFSDADSGWSTSIYDNANYYYNNGKYEIKVDIVDKIYLTAAPVDKLSSEYTVKADVLHKTQEGHLGIVFNHLEDEDLDDYYIFRFRPYTNEYKISRYNEITGDGWSTIMDWETCNAYNDKSNALKLVQNKDRISLYLNDNLLKKLDGIEVHNEGIQVGIFVSSSESDDILTDSVVGQFDNFEISGYGIE